MIGKAVYCMSAALILLVAEYASAQDAVLYKRENAGDVEFTPVDELPGQSFAPFLIGGSIADLKHWPASFIVTAAGRGTCTASLVGPVALLTAAHCVGHGKTATIVLDAGATRISGICRHADGYRSNCTSHDCSEDYALCKLDTPPKRFPFESINTSPEMISKNPELVLTGYGCTDSKGGGMDLEYRFGNAVVTQQPGQVTQPRRYENYIATSGKATVCPGDSGGGAFLVEDGGRRWLVGVNSTVTATPVGNTHTDYRNPSFLSATSTPAATAFFQAWARETGAAICGVTTSDSLCR